MKATIIVLLFALTALSSGFNCQDYSLTETKTGSSSEKKTPRPDFPSTLVATVIPETKINLFWVDNSKVEQGFTIERKTLTTEYSLLIAVGPNITSYSDNELSLPNTYYYRIRGYNKQGNSPYSNEVSAYIQINAPTNLTATTMSSSQINLSWTDNSNVEEGFKIERRILSTDYCLLTTLESNVTSYSDAGLTDGTSYYYHICAYNESGEAHYSNDVSTVTLPFKVTLPTPLDYATNISVTTQLSWGSASGATSYDVYFGTNIIPSYKTTTTGTNYNPGTLSYSTTYYWRIDSKNSGGVTTGNTWSFTTKESFPAQVTSPIPANGATNVITTTQLSWAPASGATLYDVYFGVTIPPSYKTNIHSTSYDPGNLLANTTYYWRIDSRNGSEVTVGNVWSFSTKDQVRFQLPFEVTDAVFDSLRPYLYVTDKANKKVYFVNLNTGFIEKEFSFDYMPESICIRSDGSMMYVALLTRNHDSCWWDEDGHIGYIAEFDLNTQTKAKEFVIDEDPGDIVATDNGYIVVASGSGQWSYIKCYTTSDGVKVGTSDIRALSRIKLHANQQWVYSVDTDTTDESVYKYIIGIDGSLTKSSGGGGYPQGTGNNIFLSPSGNVLVTQGGSVCHTTNDSNDRTYIQGLFASYSNIPDIAFDTINNVIFVLQGSNLYCFNSITYEQIGAFIPLSSSGSFVGVKENYIYVLRKESGKTLIVQIEHPIQGGSANTPPTATFNIAPESGNTSTNFVFDATGCTDAQDGSNNLVVKWDWNNDGVWDTAYSTTKIIAHTYTVAGTKVVRMRVRDTFGLTADMVKILNVTPRVGEIQPAYELQFTVTDVAFDPIRPYLYVTNKANKKVYFVNLNTGFIEKEFSFDYMPESICIRPNGSMMYVALLTRNHDSCWWDEDGHIGYIAEFDLNTQTKAKEFVIDEDPGDIVATDNGYIVVASGSGQWSYIKCYTTSDGVKVGISDIRALSRIKLHANQQWVYSVDTDTSSEAIQKYFINGDGSMTHSSMSSYPDFPQGTGNNIFLSPSGNVLVTQGGSVCHTTNDSNDRTYIQGLFASYSNIPDIAFDIINNVIFTLQSSNLYCFNSITYGQIGAFIPLSSSGSFVGVKENYIYVLRIGSGNTLIDKIAYPIQ